MHVFSYNSTHYVTVRNYRKDLFKVHHGILKVLTLNRIVQSGLKIAQFGS